jgi:hypothetical protein
MNTTDKLHAKFQSAVVVISGLRGLGQSTLAFTAERPGQAVVIDFGLKGEQMARDYGIRFYASPKVVGDDPSDYDVRLLAERFLEQLEAIPEGTTTLTLDNATWVEAGLGYLVARDPAKYGVHAANVQSYKEEAEEVVRPQPTIAEVKQAWLEEATKLKLINGPQDTEGLQELKKALGATYASLVPGCSAEDLKAQGFNIIRGRRGGERAT